MRKKGRVRRSLRGAFTLIELLVVISIIALLVAMLMPSLSKAKDLAKRTACANQMRNMGIAMTYYLQDNGGVFPPSTHSALAVGVNQWGFNLCQYLGYGRYNGPCDDWTKFFNRALRCPMDKRHDDSWSYGKNVWYELIADETGGPTYWTVDTIRHPDVSVLFGELKSGGSMADHFMAQFWSMGGKPEVDQPRHGNATNYGFVDTHVVCQAFKQTYDPTRNLDNWNPGTAR